MDSLRITLLIIGVIFIALVYAWERIKRRKEHDRYARWGVSDDAETHVVGRNSGDPETDTHLVSSAYENDSYSDETRYENEFDDEVDSERYDSTDSTDEPDLPLPETDEDDSQDNWESEVNASLREEPQDEDEPDLDSDPELDTNSIDDITSELEALEEIISHEPEQNEMELGNLEVSDEPVSSQPDRIIVVHVLAKEGQVFSGTDILNSLEHLGMQYGDMNVFHCMGANNKSVFSIVNAVEPGIFDLSDMDNMRTPALLLMMALPNPLPALEAYDGMLGVARSLASSLDGRLCDETRSVLTRQAIDELRSELAPL